MTFSNILSAKSVGFISNSLLFMIAGIAFVVSRFPDYSNILTYIALGVTLVGYGGCKLYGPAKKISDCELSPDAVNPYVGKFTHPSINDQKSTGLDHFYSFGSLDVRRQLDIAEIQLNKKVFLNLESNLLVLKVYERQEHRGNNLFRDYEVNRKYANLLADLMRLSARSV